MLSAPDNTSDYYAICSAGVTGKSSIVFSQLNTTTDFCERRLQFTHTSTALLPLLHCSYNETPADNKYILLRHYLTSHLVQIQDFVCGHLVND